MVELNIKSLSVVDYQNEKANKFMFSNKANLIVSNTNGEGKSSIVKSIYYALGGDIRAFPKGWDANKYIFQLEISIDTKIFIIKRQDKIISVKSDEDKWIFESFDEYSCWFQKKLGMDLKLLNKHKSQPSVASIEAILAPTYIDQDKSWDGNLFKESFYSLGRYDSKSFPSDVFDYYLGISDNKIVEKEGKKNELKKQLDAIRLNIAQLQAVYEKYRIQKNITEADSPNYDELKEDIEFYLNQTNKLSREITSRKRALSKEKTNLDILKQDFEELKKLLSKTKKRFSEVSYECVYCHSVLTREQSLTRLELEDNRLAIKIRKDSIQQKILKAEKNVLEKETDIVELQGKIDKYNERLSELKYINNIDTYVNQNVLLELKKLRVQESKGEVELDTKYKKIGSELRKLKKERTEKSKDIESRYDKFKNELSYQLGTSGVSDKKFRNYSKLKGSGTNLNKDLLTIFLAYMNLIDENSTFRIPFAIDSFVKNETDTKVLLKMFRAVDNNFLTLERQTFFSIIKENLKYINSKANVVEISSPLLKREYYRKIEKEII